MAQLRGQAAIDWIKANPGRAYNLVNGQIPQQAMRLTPQRSLIGNIIEGTGLPGLLRQGLETGREAVHTALTDDTGLSYRPLFMKDDEYAKYQKNPLAEGGKTALKIGSMGVGGSIPKAVLSGLMYGAGSTDNIKDLPSNLATGGLVGGGSQALISKVLTPGIKGLLTKGKNINTTPPKGNIDNIQVAADKYGDYIGIGDIPQFGATKTTKNLSRSENVLGTTKSNSIQKTKGSQYAKDVRNTSGTTNTTGTNFSQNIGSESSLNPLNLKVRPGANQINQLDDITNEYLTTLNDARTGSFIEKSKLGSQIYDANSTLYKEAVKKSGYMPSPEELVSIIQSKMNEDLLIPEGAVFEKLGKKLASRLAKATDATSLDDLKFDLQSELKNTFRKIDKAGKQVTDERLFLIASRAVDDAMAQGVPAAVPFLKNMERIQKVHNDPGFISALQKELDGGINTGNTGTSTGQSTSSTNSRGDGITTFDRTGNTTGDINTNTRGNISGNDITETLSDNSLDIARLKAQALEMGRADSSPLTIKLLGNEFPLGELAKGVKQGAKTATKGISNALYNLGTSGVGQSVRQGGIGNVLRNSLIEGSMNPPQLSADTANITNTKETTGSNPEVTQLRDALVMQLISTPKPGSKTPYSMKEAMDLANFLVKSQTGIDPEPQGASSITEKRNMDLGQSGLRALEDLEVLYNNDPSIVLKQTIPGQWMSREFDNALFSVVDAILRIRTGQAAPEAEVRRYMKSLGPRFGDNRDVVETKINRLREDLEAAATPMGGIASINDLLSQP